MRLEIVQGHGMLLQMRMSEKQIFFMENMQCRATSSNKARSSSWKGEKLELN